MKSSYYAICLDDPATPAFCSFPKVYFGTKSDLLAVARDLEENGNYLETASGIRRFFAGDVDVSHVIAHEKRPVLQPVEVLDSSELQLSERQWAHMNIWDYPYEMRFDSAEVSQLLLLHEEMFVRCIRAQFTGLSYLSFGDRWQPIGGFILGHPSVLAIRSNPEGGFDFGTILYMCEDSADSPDELLKKMNDPQSLLFDSIIEEVLGDG